MAQSAGALFQQGGSTAESLNPLEAMGTPALGTGDKDRACPCCSLPHLGMLTQPELIPSASGSLEA